MATRYVNTASTAGGDGTTNATSGANRAYATLAAAVAAIPTTLTEDWIIECEGTAADTAAVSITGITTGSFTITVRAAAGHEAGAQWDTNRYRLSVSGGAFGTTNPNVIVQGIQAESTDTFSSRTIFSASFGCAGSRFERCLARNATSQANTGFRGNANGGQKVVYRNCVAIGNGSNGNGFLGSAGDELFADNNTAVNWGTNFALGTGIFVARNNLGVGGVVADYSGTGRTGSTNNASEDSSAVGANPITGVATSVFVDYANGDVHLDSGAAALIGAAVDLSADTDNPFSDDIDGDARSSWDIGADEVTAGGGDVTAPTLSNPAASATGATTGSGSVDTDEGNGTLYFVVTTSSTAPSAAQVQAGQDHTGAAAVDSGSQAVSGTGTQSITGGFSGLTAATGYYAHYCHVDAASNESAVASSAQFTTDAVNTQPDTPTCTVDDQSHNSVNLSSSAFADDDVGDTHEASQWQVDEAGGDFSSPVADSGEDTVNLTSRTLGGLTPSTNYIARVRHKDDSGDAGTEWSAWSTSASFTTDAAPVGNNLLLLRRRRSG